MAAEAESRVDDDSARAGREPERGVRRRGRPGLERGPGGRRMRSSDHHLTERHRDQRRGAQGDGDDGEPGANGDHETSPPRTASPVTAPDRRHDCACSPRPPRTGAALASAFRVLRPVHVARWCCACDVRTARSPPAHPRKPPSGAGEGASEGAGSGLETSPHDAYRVVSRSPLPLSQLLSCR